MVWKEIRIIVMEESVRKEKYKDSLVMYLITKESLYMSPGKTAAQVAHGACQIYDIFSLNIKNILKLFNKKYRNRFKLFNQWKNDSFRKVVLRANDEQWNAILNELDVDTYQIVIDAGFTEIAPESTTVIAFVPMLKSDAPTLIKTLKLH